MKTENNKSLWRQFVSIGKPYWVSEKKWEALGWLGLLLLLLVAVNMLNVGLSYVNSGIMNALAKKDSAQFATEVWKLLGMFFVGTFIVVFYRYVKDKLGMTWRRWLTNSLLNRYFKNRNYYHVNHDKNIDNPDERLAVDVDGFVKGALGLLLSLLDAVITLCAFIFILYTISKLLVGIAILWAAVFTVITVFVGRRLVKLNADQFRREGDFRYNLIHVRKNAESIAFYGGEARESDQVKARFLDALSNFNFLIGWTRNLQFIVKGADYFTIAIPYLIIGPMFFRGDVELGTITQASMAFGQVLAALTIVVSEFNTVSQFTAYAKRLASFSEALDADRQAGPEAEVIRSVTAPRLALDNVTLKTPEGERVLIEGLSFTVDSDGGTLMMGPSGRGKSSLLRAVAGLWNAGSGTITRPETDEMFFVPQRPYMNLGSLREQLLYPSTDLGSVDDAHLASVLELVNLPDLIANSGGLDTVMNWADALSLGEQQRIGFARIFLAQPKFAVLDEATSALDAENEAHLYRKLTEMGITFISVGHRPSLKRYHKQVVELTGETGWKVFPSPDFEPVNPA